MTSNAIVLGPQRHEPTVRRALDDLGVDGTVGIVTAGWEERELEHQEFEDHVQQQTVNLEVFGRVERIYSEHPELRQAVRTRHDRMRALQRVHRLRLGFALDAARALFHRPEPEDIVAPEIENAIQAIRTLDAHHLERVTAVHREFEESARPENYPAVQREREALRQALDSCRVLCIAGGHVAILLNRLRMLDLATAWSALERPTIAWSAGAMALSERVMLFHDSPPQGAGNAEVFEAGLGILRGIVALPHAGHRLHLDDPHRVRIFAGRVAPDHAVVLDSGARVDFDGQRWSSPSATQRLGRSGQLEGVA